MAAKRAFTLVEIMVATAVLAVLVGLLLPVLSRVQGAGRSMQCATNLRQMALAARRYATDHDAWPTAIRYERDGDGRAVQVAWDWVTTFDGKLIGPGPLWAYSDDPDRGCQCPAFHGTTNFAGDPTTGYNYNTTYVGGEARFPAFGWQHVRAGVPPAASSRDTTCAMFGDGGRAQGTNKFMRAPLGSEPGVGLDEVYSGGQAFRHGGATNVAYLDGHVAAVNAAQTGRRADDRRLEVLMGFPENGFLSQDDRAYRPR